MKIVYTIRPDLSNHEGRTVTTKPSALFPEISAQPCSGRGITVSSSPAGTTSDPGAVGQAAG